MPRSALLLTAHYSPFPLSPSRPLSSPSMCGIAGILRSSDRDGAPIPPLWPDLLDGAIAHRGPDAQGRLGDRRTHADGRTAEVVLLHRRLAIIDPVQGRQPMTAHAGPGHGGGGGANSTLAVVFNGCIYNHRALRTELQAAGHRFETDHSDTEVLLHGYRQWGEALPTRLEGMFALAIWDRSRGLLFLARDPCGEKPLYYTFLNSGNLFAFASTPAALVRLAREADPPMATELAAAAIGAWIGFGFGSDLPYARLASLPPGHQLSGPKPDSPDPWTLHRYDSPPQERDPDRPLDALAVEKLLADAVAERLEADAPLGCFLSGGIDSSLVAVFAKRHLADLNTFTVRMPDARFDESRHAAGVAKRLFTRHTTLDCDPHPAEDLVRLITQLGLPFGDSSILPTYWVSKATRGAGVKVALSGDGGDELFAGYDRYRAALAMGKWRWLMSLLPFDLLRSADPKSTPSRLARLGVAARRGYPELVRIFPSPDLDRLGIRVNGASLPPSPRPSDPVSDPMLWDFEHYLPEDLLRKVDTASMSVALEVRCPFLDPQVVNAALTAPISALMPGGERKGLLKQVARKFLPQQVLDRPKMGFSIPVGEWFRTNLGGMKTLLIDHLGSAEPWGPADLGLQLDRAAVGKLITEHMDSRRDHSQRLFTLLSLSIWAKSLGGAPGGPMGYHGPHVELGSGEC